MNYILGLDVEDFVELLDKAIEKEGDKNEREFDKFLLHRWGYELQFMEEPMQFSEYRNISLGLVSSDTNNSKNDKANVDNEDLIKRIEKLKKFDQARNAGNMVVREE